MGVISSLGLEEEILHHPKPRSFREFRLSRYPGWCEIPQSTVGSTQDPCPALGFHKAFPTSGSNAGKGQEHRNYYDWLTGG